MSFKMYIICKKSDLEAGTSLDWKTLFVGDTNRQWLQPYPDMRENELGIRSIVPESPDHPDSILDALLLFYPEFFTSCPAQAEVRKAMQGVEYNGLLDFDLAPEKIPEAWPRLREESRALFNGFAIWAIDFESIQRL